jgi:hypothetical protein
MVMLEEDVLHVVSSLGIRTMSHDLPKETLVILTHHVRSKHGVVP